MPSAAHTVGSLAFAEVVRRQGPAEVGRALKRTSAAVSNWAAARRSPKREVREAIASAYGVPAEDWDKPAPSVVPASAPQEAPQPAPVPTPAVAKGEAMPPSPSNAQETPEEAPEAASVVAEQLADLRREQRRLATDPKATTRERVQNNAALTAVTKLHAKLSGSLELTPSQVLRSPVWRSLQTVLVEALRPWPDAMAAAAKALRAFDAKGGGTAR